MKKFAVEFLSQLMVKLEEYLRPNSTDISVEFRGVKVFGTFRQKDDPQVLNDLFNIVICERSV